MVALPALSRSTEGSQRVRQPTVWFCLMFVCVLAGLVIAIDAWLFLLVVLAASVAGLVLVDVIRSRSHDSAHRARASSNPRGSSAGGVPRWWLLVPVSIVIALDGTNFFSGGARRYVPALLVLVPLTLAVAFAPRRARVGAIVHMFTASWAIGMAISVYALLGGSENTWLQVFLPMSIAVLLSRIDLGPDRTIGLAGLCKLLAVGTSIVAVGSASTHLLGLTRWSGLTAFAHESAFVAVAAIAMCWALRLRWLLVLNVVALGVAFVAYPAATYPMVVLTGVAAAVAQYSRRAGAARTVGSVVMVTVLACGSYFVLAGSQVTNEYASSVNKADNSGFRQELWSSAYDDFRESPWIGSAFTGSYAIPRSSSFRYVLAEVPAHNEYLSLLRSGGVVGLIVVVGPIFAAVQRAWSRSRTSSSDWRRLVIAINSAALAYLAAAAFNPVMARPAMSTFGWFIVGLVFCTIQIPRPDQSTPEHDDALIPTQIPQTTRAAE